jgi:hypothetical protein
MFKGVLFIFIASNLCFSQSIKNHIVYFDTNKYEVIETEQNRLLFFVQNLDKSKIKESLFMVFVTIAEPINTILYYPKKEQTQ